MCGEIRSRRTKHLTFSDDVHRLDSLDDSPRRPQATWPLHGSKPSLDTSVIRLNAIVRVLAGTVATVWIQPAFGLQLANGCRVIRIRSLQNRRGSRLSGLARAFSRKALAASPSRVSDRKKSTVSPCPSTARNKYVPAAGNTDIGRIHMPRRDF